MSEFTGAEFTGERVIPGLVNADLFNEHLARYRFAKHVARGLNAPATILDAGCGSGYGTAELALGGALVAGTDISADAVRHASENYSAAGLRFLQAACEALPFEAASFDLVAAFEVIEHLDRWQELLTEARRVLKPSGILLVSTPNRDYYAESRGASGPNPFHRHEFDYEEFRQSLEAVFPYVHIWTENHAEAIVFSPREPDSAVLEASGSAAPAMAHFYLAACSHSPVASFANEIFAWVPSSANLLRERERHIAKLNQELEKKDAWLGEIVTAHGELQREHEVVTAEMVRRNNWAAELDREIATLKARVEELQKELETRLAWIAGLEAQIGVARIETHRLNEESLELRQQAQARFDRLEATVEERTRWAERLNFEIAEYRAELKRIESSKWYRTGAMLGLGPRLRDLR